MLSLFLVIIKSITGEKPFISVWQCIRSVPRPAQLRITFPTNHHFFKYTTKAFFISKKTIILYNCESGLNQEKQNKTKGEKGQ